MQIVPIVKTCFLEKIRKTISKSHLLKFLPRVLGPVGQSIVSLTSSLVVKMLTVPVTTVFLLKKCAHFFSKNINVYAILNDQSFNDM